MKIFFDHYLNQDNYQIGQILDANINQKYFVVDFNIAIFKYSAGNNIIYCIRNREFIAVLFNNNQIIFTIDDQNIDYFLDIYNLLQ